MTARASEFPTLFEILSSVNVGKHSHKKITDGMTMDKVPQREGVVVLTPSQLLSIRVPLQVVVKEQIRGYQRHLQPAKSRDLARKLDTYVDDAYMRELPVAEVSIDGDFAYWTDGQHRGAAHVIANRPMRVLVTRRTADEARRLFLSQGSATRPNRNVLIFNGDEPIDEYIQDAVTSNDHPWSKLVTASTWGGNSHRLSATTARMLLTRYLGSSVFDRNEADRLAALLSAFGTKQSNQLAFGAKSLQAIAMVARSVFREREEHPKDRDRWATTMPRFNFAVVQYHPVSEITYRLLQHWNKRLPDARQAKLP